MGIVEVEKITFTPGEPEPDCEKCHGTGSWGGVHCICKFRSKNSKVKREMVKQNIEVEELPDGGMRMHIKDV